MIMKRIFNENRSKLRKIRQARVRVKVKGTAERPRLSVFRSLKNVTLQLIDDERAKTLCFIDSRQIKEDKAGEKTGKIAKAFLAGKLLAIQAGAKNITKVIFDRGGYKYHGRVKAAAEGARAGGLVF